MTEALLRIPTTNVGDQVTLTIQNFPSADEMGALGNPGDTQFSQSALTVAAVGTTSNGPMAFAIYRAPVDFPRASGQDADQKERTVNVQVQITPLNSASLVTTVEPILIVRPPLVLVHGLWSSWTTWNNFAPLVTGASTVDPRFSVGRVSYDELIGPALTSSSPEYPSPVLFLRARANSLGFVSDAADVLRQIQDWIGKFKEGQNPAGVSVAAVQADIVAHSMGGDVARTMALFPGFLDSKTYGQGYIHKLITIDTPHLGTPLASMLLSPQEEGGCLENLLALVGDFVFYSASFGSTAPVSGAMADLTPLSPAIVAIAAQGPHPIPTALIAGVYTNFANLSPDQSVIGLVCSAVGDPIAEDLTPTGWLGIFNNQNNDALVSETSQLNGQSPSTGFFAFTSLLHSPGLTGATGLGFSGTSVLDPGPADPVPGQVIQLLNTPVAQTVFNALNP